MKHTPGPWEVHETDEGHEIRMGEAILSPYKHDVEQVVPYDHGLDPRYNKVQYETAEANARLLATAPDLLQACISACEYYEMLERQTGVEHGVLKELRSVISKAKGESSRMNEDRLKVLE